MNFFGENLDLFQSCIKSFKGPNFLLCCLLFGRSTKYKVPWAHYLVISCWDGFSPAGLCFAISFEGEHTCFLCRQQNILLRNSVIG